MLEGQRIAVVLPAYNAASTLERTYRAIPLGLVDDVLLVDDASQDDTVSLARELGLHTYVHPTNRGYGGNQKTCYSQALKLRADVFIMLHPDYQYTPRLVPAMAAMVVSGEYDMVLGSRILGGGSTARGDAPVQVLRQPSAHRRGECVDLGQAVRISLRIPGLFTSGARDTSSAGKLR